MIEQRYFGGLSLEQIADAMQRLARDGETRPPLGSRVAGCGAAGRRRGMTVDRELWQRARSLFDELVDLDVRRPPGAAE